MESVQDSLHNGYHVGLGNLIKMDKPVLAAVEGRVLVSLCFLLVVTKLSWASLLLSSRLLKNWIDSRRRTNWPHSGSWYQKAFRMAEAQRVHADECVEIGLCSEIAEDGKCRRDYETCSTIC